jgi:hypothetical protein
VTIAVNKSPTPQQAAATNGGKAASKAQASALKGQGLEEAVKGEAVVDGEFAELLSAELEPMLAMDMDGSANALAGQELQVAELQASGKMSNMLVMPEGSTLDLAIPAGTEPTPKVMDANLIKQVQDVVLPEGEQAQMPVQLQDLVANKASGVERAPAIDFEASTDPQLMNFEDFVSQRNAFNKKAGVPQQAYGMPQKHSLNANHAHNKAEKLKHVDDLAAITGTTTAATLALSMDAAPATDKVATSMSAPSKVFDMNALNGKSLDADSVITQITDYVVQARAAKEPTVELKMQHADLGQIDITVTRHAGDMVNIAINAQDSSAKLFLGQHRDQLLTHLNQAGVGVNDFRLDSSSAGDSATGQQQSSFSGQGQERQFGSEQNQRREEQQRRQDLWKQFQQEVA